MQFSIQFCRKCYFISSETRGKKRIKFGTQVDLRYVTIKSNLFLFFWFRFLFFVIFYGNAGVLEEISYFCQKSKHYVGHMIPNYVKIWRCSIINYCYQKQYIVRESKFFSEETVIVWSF